MDRLKLLDPAIQQFIEANIHRPPADLLLKSSPFPSGMMPYIAEQIAARKKAAKKLREWLAQEKIIYTKLAMEQCSSSSTALFKSRLCRGSSMVDLTGGFGVDTSFFAKEFAQVTHVEPDEELQTLVKHNLKQLGFSNVAFFQGDARTFLNRTSAVDLVYLDPSRRDEAQKKVFLLEDCEPQVLPLLPLLLEKSPQVLLKTSPMLDIQQAVSQLQYVHKVWVVAVKNEVKELLFLLKKESGREVEIEAVELKEDQNAVFRFTRAMEEAAKMVYSLPLNYLYEPYAAVLKAGGFKYFAQKYQLQKLHPNSHLYTSEALQKEVPGRVFQLLHRTTYQKKSLQRLLPAKKANITVRNFPQGVQQIRKKLNIREGGEEYVFATTDRDEKPCLLVTKKIR